MTTEQNTPDTLSSEPQAPAETPLAPAPEPVVTWRERVGAMLSNPKAPLIAGGLLVLLLGGFGVSRFISGQSAGNVVVFDPVKFMNAQRAAATLLTLNPNADLTLAMTQVAKQAESVISEEAHGAIVLVKQAVVVPTGIPDITDAVLTRFGLPTDVPTVTTSGDSLTIENLAPTDSSISAGRVREEYMMELQEKSRKAQEAANSKEAQKNVIP